MVNQDPRTQPLIETIESAFRPLRCTAQVWDYGERVKFRIYTPEGDPLIEYPEEILHDISAPDVLEQFIQDVRGDVEASGFRLDPWELPSSYREVMTR